MNRDFKDILNALSAAGAEYLIVGAHALAAHGYLRTTGDLDIWVRPTEENARRVWQALHVFGAPLGELTLDDLQKPDLVYQMGVVPVRIDMLTSISGVNFEESWSRRMTLSIDGQQVTVISRDDLIRNKTATGRPKDLTDVDYLHRGDPEHE